MHDYEGGAKEILRAAQLERAPGWLASLGVRLFSESGEAFAALQLSVPLYQSLQDSEGRERLARRIRSLNYTLQKAAWRESLEKFHSRFQRTPTSLDELEKQTPHEKIDRLLSQISSANEPISLLAERFSFRYDPLSRSIEGNLSTEDRFLEDVGIYKEKSVEK